MSYDSALAGCDKLISEPQVIENQGILFVRRSPDEATVQIRNTSRSPDEAALIFTGARVAFEDEFGAAEEREVSCEAQQGRSRVKMKLFGSCRNNMGNEPILALPEGSDNFVVMSGTRVRMLGDVRTLIIEEAHAMKYSIRPGVRRLEVEDEHQRSSGCYYNLRNPIGSGKGKINYGYNTKKKVARHGVHVSSIPDKDGMYIETDGQSERTFQTLENMFRAYVRNLVVVGILTFCEVSFPTKIVIIRVFEVFSLEVLYGRRGRSPVGASKMIGLELEQETTKVVVI
ncbi:hypothetical protein Tco_1344044 [Tanacetum coccineum]